MKRNTIILMILFTLMPMTPGFAQNPVAAIDALDIEIWPDYDKASVLVLLTGTLPGDTQFPASVTLLLPEAAQLNAVARIDRKDGVMKDDIISSPGPSGTLTFITPDLRFRVEYYIPYTVNNNQRSFDYTWLTPIPVNNLTLRVQQPAAARTLNTEPAAANVAKRGDGFVYHTFPARAIPAGHPFSLHVDYTMTTAQLSVESLPPLKTDKQSPGLPATSSPGSGINWPVVAIITGGLIILAVLVWQMASRRPSANVRRPPDTRSQKQSQAKFCPNCGEAVNRGDRFCRECGLEL
jgi:hypothetical protein